MKAVVALEAPLGFRIAYGAITDDLRDDRPGMRAAEKLGVSAPLLEAGIGKGDVRALAQKWDLSVKDKPAGACLASRIERGLEVTHERLAQVERAEIGLAALGFRQFRVRYHGSVARIELDEAGLRRIQTPGIREEAIRVTREAGFRFVSVDLQEFRSGSLNPADSQ